MRWLQAKGQVSGVLDAVRSLVITMSGIGGAVRPAVPKVAAGHWDHRQGFPDQPTAGDYKTLAPWWEHPTPSPE